MGSVISFAIAGYSSTWSLPTSIELSTVGLVLLVWGVGFLVYPAAGVFWSRIRRKPRSTPVPGVRPMTWRMLAILGLLSVVALSAFFVILEQETQQVGCFACGVQAATYINAASCYADSRSCRIVLVNIGSSDRQVVGCFWADPNTGRILSNGTLLINDTAPPLKPSASHPYTVHAQGTVSAYCLDYMGTPNTGARVVPGVKEAGGYLTSYWGNSTDPNLVWQ
jgi:hypothetical protein